MPKFRVYEVLRVKKRGEVILEGPESSSENAVKKAWRMAEERFKGQEAKGIHYSDQPIQYELWTATPVELDKEGGLVPVAYETIEEYHCQRTTVVELDPGTTPDDAIGVQWKVLSSAFDQCRLPLGYIAPYRLELWSAEEIAPEKSSLIVDSEVSAVSS